MSNEKKSLERKALNTFLQNNRKLKRYMVEERERPDFILINEGYKIGIEHFRADTILNEYTDSESMKLDGQRKKMYEKHHEKLLNDEFDADISAKDLEAYMNKSIDASLTFDYKTFINNLKDVFEQHANRVPEYKKKCNEIWFLIDIGIENEHLKAKFNNGGKTNMNILPVTGDMLNIFDKHKEISRVIVCSRCLGIYKIIYDSKGKKYGYKIHSFTYIDPGKKIKLVGEDDGKEVKS